MAGAWLPADDTTTFLTPGIQHFRYWWNMERPPGRASGLACGVELRTFDGSDHASRNGPPVT
jgi:hypothetical protein